MPGSSRALQRSLDAAFTAWDPDWDSSPSQTTSALYSAIDAYNEKHNSTSSISTNLGDILRNCYVTHVGQKLDLSRQIFFVEILIRLVKLLATEDVKPWIHTYLRPALNSAGLDLVFVDKARRFFVALSVPCTAGDAQIAMKRDTSANLALEYLVRAYIGNDTEISTILGVSNAGEAANTHEHIERLRFIERNAGLLLRELGAKTAALVRVINAHFVVAQHRHKMVALLSLLCGAPGLFSQNSQSELFPNLIRSLLFDHSESVLTSGLYLAVMISAQTYTSVSRFLPDLFAVVFRLTGWSEFSRYTEKNQNNGTWDTVSADTEPSIMQPHLFNGDFNLLYLLTMLYGLFPRHTFQFCTSPLEYWKLNTPNVISPEQLENWLALLSPEANREITDNIKLQCRRFMIHPSILLETTLEQELTNPTRWIGENPSEDDIVLACYQLNPDIMLTIPDNVVLPRWMLERITRNSLLSESRLFHSARESMLGAYSRPESMRNSLVDDRHLRVPTPWEAIEKRMSIVPTKLVVENGTHRVSDPHDGITFRPFNFGTSSTEGLEAGTFDEKSDPKKKGSVSDLYLMHERLFTSGTNVGLEVKSPTATGNMLTWGKTATDLLSELKEGGKEGKDENDREAREKDGKDGKDGKDAEGTEDGQISEISTFNGRPGNALEFYQRELLLMKNELEFSSYMKHLNKVNYLKLRSQYNALRQREKSGVARGAVYGEITGKSETETREQETQESEKSKTEPENNRSPEGEHPETSEISEFPEHSDDTQSSSNLSQHILSVLSTRVAQLKSSTLELQEKIASLQIEVSDSKNEAAAAREDALVSGSQLHRLQCELQVLKAEHEKLLSKPTEPEPEPPAAQTPSLDNQERTIFDLHTQIKMAKDQNSRLSSELAEATESLEFTKKAYEQKITSLNLEKGQAARALASHHERTIQELHLALAKFEAALEERNARILQLSTSKPIRIPEPEPVARPRFRSPEDSDYFAMSSIESSLSSNPSRPIVMPRVSSTTVLRGRGGYQKRSKKM